MTNSLNPVPVGIDHEGGKVIPMILGPQPRLTVVSATRTKRGGMKRLNRRTIRRTEAQVHAMRRQRIAWFDRDGELDAERASHGSIVRTTLLEVDNADDSKWPQHGIIEPTALLQVPHAHRHVVDHLSQSSSGLTTEFSSGAG